MKYTLAHPIDVGGKSISAVTIRRPKGRDMAKIGDDFAIFSRYIAANAPAILAVAANEEAASKIDAAHVIPPGAAEYKAMLGIAQQMAGLSEDEAGELDLEDLNAIALGALIPGEATGRT